MKAYIINMDRCVERMQRMTSLMERLGLSYERVGAVDGKQLDAAALAALVDVKKGYAAPSAGEIGCFLSHRKCWQQISQADEAYALIFEDDIVFARNIFSLLPFEGLTSDADLIRLEGWGARALVSRSGQALADGYSLRDLYAGHIGGSAAYIVSKKFAKILYDFTDKYIAPVDFYLYDFLVCKQRKCDYKIVTPAPCFQYSFLKFDRPIPYLQSTIDGRYLPIPLHKKFFMKIQREISRSIYKVGYFLTGKRLLRNLLHPSGSMNEG